MVQDRRRRRGPPDRRHQRPRSSCRALILGHERPAHVIEVGEGVTDFAVGDNVVAKGIYSADGCRFCKLGPAGGCATSRARRCSPCSTAPAAPAPPPEKPLNVFAGVCVMAEYAVTTSANWSPYGPQGPGRTAPRLRLRRHHRGDAAINTARVEPGSPAGVRAPRGGPHRHPRDARSPAPSDIAIDTSDASSRCKVFGATTYQGRPGEDLTKQLKATGAASTTHSNASLGRRRAEAYKADPPRRHGRQSSASTPANATTTIVTRSLPFEKNVTGSYFRLGAAARKNSPTISRLPPRQAQLEEMIPAAKRATRRPRHSPYL